MPINVLNGLLKSRQFDKDNGFAGNSILISRAEFQDCTRGGEDFQPLQVCVVMQLIAQLHGAAAATYCHRMISTPSCTVILSAEHQVARRGPPAVRLLKFPPCCPLQIIDLTGSLVSHYHPRH